MILVTLVLGAIAFFVCFVYIKPVIWRTVGTLLALVFLIPSLLMINLNDHDHFGMKKVTTTTTKVIYSADPTGKMNMMLYQNIGTKGTENTQIYATKKGQKKPGHTQVNENTFNHVKSTAASTATLTTKETRWVYKNNTTKLWFNVANNNHELIKRTNTFHLPNDWVHLSTTQAKQLKAQMAKQQTPAAQAQVKQQAAAFVKQQMQAAIAKDPSLANNQAKQQQLSKQYAAQFQSQLIKKAVANLK